MNYIQIPYLIFENQNLSDQHKLFFGWLNFKCNKNGYMWYTNKSIETEAKIKKRVTQLYLKKLSENRYIYIDQKASNQALYSGSFKNKDGKENLYWDVVKGKRVIWIYESWLKANDDLKYPKHPTKQNKAPTSTPTNQDYKKFMAQTAETYVDETLMIVNDKHAIGIDILGHLVRCDHQGHVIEFLSTAEALKIWRYMFTHQERMLNPGTGAILIHN